MRTASVRIPSRIDFAGGWSDVPDFSCEEGGAVLNAAIDLYSEGQARWDEDGLNLSLRLDVPPDSHLGTSSATNLAWVELIAGLTERTPSAVERAEQAFGIERAMGEKGGKQDQYAAALGGFNLLRFREADDPAKVEPVILADEAVAELADCCLLAFAEASPDSSELHAGVWCRFGQGDAEVRRCLRAIRDSVEPAREALERSDWPALAAEMTRNRELARALGGGAVTERMDALFKVGERAGALGAKGCGAGGGGYLLFLCGPDGRGRVEQALADCGAPVRRFGFAPRRDGAK